MPERDWYDWIAASSSVIQTVAVACGVIFAIYEFRGHEERDRQARIEESRKAQQPIDRAVSSSVQEASKALASQADQDLAQLKKRRWVSALQPKNANNDRHDGFPVRLQISEAVDAKDFLEKAAKATSTFLDATSDYRRLVAEYVQCIDLKSCEPLLVKPCRDMTDYMQAVSRYFSKTNTITTYDYYLPEDFHDVQDLTDEHIADELVKSNKVGSGANIDSTYLNDLESKDPFNSLGDFVALYSRLCRGGWRPEWLFSGSSGASW